MIRRLSALLLVALFGLGFVLGPHPCSALHGKEESRTSCHETETSSNGPEVRGGDQDCCTTFCQHACHGTAIAEGGPVVFAISPVSGATVEPSGSGPTLFAHPIDHIPLA